VAHLETSDRPGAGVIALDSRIIVRVIGDDRASFLHGMCTADVKSAPFGAILRPEIVGAPTARPSRRLPAMRLIAASAPGEGDPAGATYFPSMTGSPALPTKMRS